MYPTLVTLSLILVFGSSAFMSISGLLSIFSNNTITIISMGLGMEIGKILSISHLYRTWQRNNILVKTGYIFIVFVLILLTSFEVMGFLSQCHQKTVQSNHIIQSRVDALSEEEAVLRSQINTIDQTLNGLPKTHVSRRINERKNSGYEDKQNRILEIIKHKAELEAKLISEKDYSNPVSSIAKILKINDSKVISIFIPFLVLILEPLSIGLTIAANSAWMNNKKSIPPPKTDFKDTKNQTEELQSLQEKHNLTVSQIAKITGRKKLKTCEGWIDGTIPTPPRALAEIQAWVEKEYAKPVVV
jgi:hypothetical protein